MLRHLHKQTWLIKLSSRNEASTIPALLVAPNAHEVSDLYDGTNGHSRGYYDDGAYIASRSVEESLDGSVANTGNSQRDSDADTSIHAGIFFHASLLRRFEHCRRQVRTIPPVPDPGRTPRAWRMNVLNSVPQSAQLALMPQDTVQRLLRRMPKIMKRAHWLEGDGAKGYRLSTWLWGLLAKLDDLGTLSSEEVSDIRELGRRAGTLALGLDVGEAEDSYDHEEIDRGGETDSFTMQPVVVQVTSSQSSEERLGRFARTQRPDTRRRNSSSSLSSDNGLEAAKREALSKLTSITTDFTGDKEATVRFDFDVGCPGEESLMATLDMVLTVVGECYGQRDLLVARDRLWQHS